jgi:cobyrinic acid a,c-diamide synthase
MVGAVPVDVVVEERPQGRWYMLLEETTHHPWPAATTKAMPGYLPVHEFHHGRLVNVEPGAVFAHRVKRGAGIDGRHDALVVNRLVAGFAHHRNTLRNPWVERFVDYLKIP